MSNGCVATVAICTHNRAVLAAAAAEVAVRQAIPLEAEVLVVDNASDDHTPAVLEALVARHPQAFRTVHEPRLGLSHARNRALAEARAPVIVYLDDDAIPRPGWLPALLAPFVDARAAAAGGRIVLRFPGGAPPPPWLSPELSCLFSAFDAGDTPRILRYGRADYPYGANIAFRVDAARAAGGFSGAVGPRGHEPFVHDETDLCYRLERAGGTIHYVPNAVVDHHVLKERVSPAWVLRRATHGGHSAALFILRNRGVLRAIARIAWLYGGSLASRPYRLQQPVDPARLLRECRRREALAYVRSLLRNLPRARLLAREARVSA